MRKILVLTPLALLAACAPAQRIAPYTADFKATPEQFVGALESITKSDIELCPRMRTAGGIGYKPAQLVVSSPTEASIVVQNARAASALTGASGVEFKFNLRNNGEYLTVSANSINYLAGGNQTNPTYLEPCITNIFNMVGKQIQRVK